MGRKSKASNFERELLSKFHEIGFNGVRVAGSGSSQHPSPDLLVGKNGQIYAVEVKTSRNDYFYIPKNQILELNEFSKNLKARPLIGVKFVNQRDWFFLPLTQKMMSTENKNVRINLKDLKSGFKLQNFVNKSIKDF